MAPGAFWAAAAVLVVAAAGLSGFPGAADAAPSFPSFPATQSRAESNGKRGRDVSVDILRGFGRRRRRLAPFSGQTFSCTA